MDDTADQNWLSRFWDWFTTPTGTIEDFLPKSKVLDSGANLLDEGGHAIVDLSNKLGWAMLIFAGVLAVFLTFYVIKKL